MTELTEILFVVKSASMIGSGMKLGQFEEFYPKVLQYKFKEICSKPGGVDHPLVFFNKSE